MRIDGRALDELRSVKFTPDFTKFAEGSCLVEMGDTVVLCNASVEEKLPPHVRSGGWITAEYSMLPRANRERSKRDIAKLKLNGRSAEIQRLIGRSLRSAVVIALRKLVAAGKLEKLPVSTFVAAVSAGIVDNVPMLDLRYQEDSRAMVDLNCVMTAEGGIIELQGTGEGRPFTMEEQQELIALCRKGIGELTARQKALLGDLV